ncbi:MAG: BatA domain-containing protein, partial [Vicinamibacterales bacterium]
MITWLNAAALVGLSAVTLPVVVHLLLRDRSPRVLVPSIRFIVRTRESAVRLQRPSDVLLLLVRITIIACAALALAAPLVITERRQATWNSRTMRAIVVDASDSVDGGAAAATAAASSKGSTAFLQIHDADLKAGITRASAWLRAAPPGRQELVVVSDFHEGAVVGAMFAVVPAAAGIRTMPVARRPLVAGDIDGGSVVYGSRTYAQRILVEAAATSFILRDIDEDAGVDFMLGASASPSLGALARTVAAVGIFRPPADRPAVVAFGSTGRAAEVDDPAAIAVDAPEDSFEAANVVYQALASRRDLPRLREFESQTIPSPTLTGWTRESGRADATAWQRS